MNLYKVLKITLYILIKITELFEIHQKRKVKKINICNINYV
jgi:hypothetical protein